MAERRQHLAKSMVARIPPSPVRCEVLYLQRGTSPAGHVFAAHAHPFWQLEIAQAGAFRCLGLAGEHRLLPGDGLLIPAQVAHGFRYDRRSRHLSVKMRVEGVAVPAAVLPLRALAGWPALRAALLAMVDLDRPDRARQHAAGHLLAALVALASAPRTPIHDPPSFVERVRALVEHDGNRRWTVTAVAAALGCSASHASAVFRTQAALSLKSFLDQARQEAAAQVLAATTRSIGEVAEELGFPDIFAFSRFIKRVAGVSPRDLRRRLQQPG